MSILAEAKPAKDLAKIQFIKALLMGESKTGKTTSLLTLPQIENKPHLVVALTPRSASTLNGANGVELIEIFEEKARAVPKMGVKEYKIQAVAWEKLYSLLIELWEIKRAKRPFPYSSIMLDDLDSASKYCMNHVLGLKKKDGKDTEKQIGGGPAQLHYVPYMLSLTQVLFSFLLPLPCHIIVCGHMELREDEDTQTLKYYPTIFGKLRTEISSWFDEVYECTKETNRTTKEIQYFWNTTGTGQKDLLGSTLNKQNKLWQSPFQVNLDEPKAGFAKLLELIRSRK